MKHEDNENDKIKQEGYESIPEEAPPERTGLTPEEMAYEPETESRPLPKAAFIAIAIFLLCAFAGGGFWYYRSTVLPEKYFQTATRLYQSGDYEGALELYRRVEKLRPERRNTLLYIGDCLEALGRSSEAIIAYNHHLENQPKDADAYVKLGAIYMRAGMIESALAPFEKAAKLSPKNPEVRYSLGKIYQNLGSPERAKDNFTKAVEGDTDDVELLLSASKALMTLGEYESALEGYDKAEEIASNDARAAHGAKAARAMLGLPTDERLMMIPGKSIGLAAIGMTEDELNEKLGSPTSVTSSDIGGKTYITWNYSGNAPTGALTALFDDGRVVQLKTSSSAYRTPQGLGLENFLLPKYEGRFTRFRENNETAEGYKYALTSGGITFYVAALGLKPPEGKELRAAIVHTGAHPIGDSGDPQMWIPAKQVIE